MAKRVLSDIVGQRWYMSFDGDDPGADTIEILRPDPDRKGAYVGPLAQILIGLQFEGDHGESILGMTGEDGLVAQCVHLLPEIARLILAASKLGEKPDTENIVEVATLGDALRQAIDHREDENTGGMSRVFLELV